MAYGQLNMVLAHVRRLVHQPGAGVDDGVLLERFVRQRDEAAFEVLVWRHGPMVLSLARRLLRSPHDAEDVLQATFLTLVRKANSIGKHESIASWLYKVGYRIAIRARARSSKVPVPAGLLEHVPAGPANATDGELRPLLDRAILRLPEKNRAAIVLCHFEGKTIREAAAQLGCPAGTVAARLSRGRELLRRRLCRDGVAITSGAVAAALSEEVASAAVPAALVTATLRSAWASTASKATVASIPATISALVESGSAATTLAKCSLGVAVIVGGILALGASALARRDNAAAPPVLDARELSPAPAPRGNPDPPVRAAKKPPADDTMIVTGRVLGPDGKPVAGARLYYPRWPDETRPYPSSMEVPERGVSGADGRFRLELPRSEMPSDYDYCLVAACEGFGVDGAKVPRKDATAELTIRLVRDQPIEGRILGLEGRPIAGVEVSVGSVYASPEESVDPFLGGWRGDNWAGAQRCMAKMLFLPMGERLPATVFTDRDGRFRISGAGKERAVDLITKGDKVAEERFYVLTRSGFDPTPFNRASVLNTRQGPVPLLHGAKFDHVATVPRIIEGTIRDGVNRKPVAGVPISADLSQIQTFTSDERGRYRVWTSKRTQYELYVDPSSERGLLPRAIELLDKDGSAPIRVDIDLYHGVVVAGRLIDKATGKGVQGFVHFTPLGDTEKVAKKLGYQAWRETSKTDGDGRFRLITPPGNGFLAAAVHVKVARLGGGPINPYKQASIDPADRSRLTIKKDRTGRLYLGLPSGFSSRLESACKMLDVPQGATAATCDLFVDPGKSLIVKVQDPEGKPLAGAAVAGVMVDQMMEISLDTDECPVYGLDPDVPRRLLIFHQARNLAATMTVRGDETEPIVARLLPAGTMVGRLIDADGQPVADTWIEPDFQTSEAQGLYLDLSHKRKQVRTDKDGRFRMAGVIPDSKVTMLLIRGRRNLNAEAWASPKQVAVGQTLDVGDVRATSR